MPNPQIGHADLNLSRTQCVKDIFDHILFIIFNQDAVTILKLILTLILNFNFFNRKNIILLTLNSISKTNTNTSIITALQRYEWIT